MGRQRACWTSSTTCSSGRPSSRSSFSRSGGRSSTQRRPSWGTSMRLAPLAAGGDARRCSTGWCPGLPRRARHADPPAGRGRAALRGRDRADAARPGRADPGGQPLRGHGRRSMTLEVPETLHALVAARLDDLDAGRAIAAPGRGRARALVHAARRWRRSASAANRRYGRCSTRLVAKQVLGFDDDPRSAERGQYHFLQALLRTIALQHALASRPQGTAPGRRRSPAQGIR